MARRRKKKDVKTKDSKHGRNRRKGGTVDKLKGSDWGSKGGKDE